VIVKVIDSLRLLLYDDNVRRPKTLLGCIHTIYRLILKVRIINRNEKNYYTTYDLTNQGFFLSFYFILFVFFEQ
jgi:hypothetical protein